MAVWLAAGPHLGCMGTCVATDWLLFSGKDPPTLLPAHFSHPTPAHLPHLPAGKLVELEYASIVDGKVRSQLRSAVDLEVKVSWQLHAELDGLLVLSWRLHAELAAAC